MTEDGQQKVLPLVEGIHTRGATDIYKAVCEALSIIELRDDKSRNPAIMLFTDGVPNRSPPDGEIKALSNILRTKNLACPIHTFGFGYNLDSNLLYDIANMSNGGMNGFIPDASLVGTIFVNAISNILTTAAINVQFKMEYDNEALEAPIIGDLNFEKTATDITINVGTVRYGQPLEFLIKLSSNEEFSFKQKLTYEAASNCIETQPKTSFDSVNEPSYTSELFRFEAISALKVLLNRHLKEDERAELLEKFILSQKEPSDKIFEGILLNLSDQVSIAVSK